MLKRRIMNEFLTRIGINNANMDKKERMITSEVESNTEETDAGISHWYQNIKIGLEETNKMFPDLNLSVTINKYGNKGEEVESDESK